jgi:glycosyltransferase involved in cell wall biosynthesis
MNRKKVLLVAMLDSVHTARWLAQFRDSEIDFYVLASKKHKFLHPLLIDLVKGGNKAKFKLLPSSIFLKYFGFLDYGLFIFPNSRFNLNTRKYFLKLLLNIKEFDFIHALEIQGAGYLVAECLKKEIVSAKFILTNWGSDIFHFKNNPSHAVKIRFALSRADFYSAECVRDYRLAREFGFNGTELPCIPNAGGFIMGEEIAEMPSGRSQIIAKAYGGEFGRGDLVIESLSEVLADYPNVSAYLYSVTDDLIDAAIQLKMKFPGRIEFRNRRNPLSRNEISQLFQNSRVYIGASRSDGISTSFLEAIIFGCYPIQTNTSCASEWVSQGIKASIVGQSVVEISQELKEALKSDSLVDSAFKANQLVAKEKLEAEIIRKVALTFYS